ncbi:hypothetical protein CAEBREN_07148 [Caenorhabditis brenneri]|uniref:G-protein coupled receptors family 1 profile domain-containing protein n=1 Tax=Caenorhabditis brenneri TaxID=135651 RepID=G0NEG8_CAEBE|nr:hypothetical protein CAEBREN_07148 [Caenorhabditis brenneri]
MLLAAFSVTVISIICAFITGLINAWLLHSLFISKKLKKSQSLTFFYVRFGVDGLLAVINIIILFFISLKLLQFDYLLNPYPNLIFFTVWSAVNTTSIRTLLAIITALDRTFAVFLPLTYHISRTKLNNSLLICLVLGYPLVENIILWVICNCAVTVAAGCVNFTCLANKCFHGYSLNFEMANFLALIDAIIMMIFDVIPAGIQSKFGFKVEDVGSLMTFSKMSGLALEGYLVYRAMKRRNGTVTTNSNGKNSVLKVKASGDK